MDRKRAIIGGVLGAAVGIIEFFSTRHYTHAPSDPGLSGIGQAFGRGLTVVALSLVCTSVAAAILRLRYWAAVGVAAIFAQVVVLVMFRAATQAAHLHGDARSIILPLSAIAVMTLIGLVAPVKPSPSVRGAQKLNTDHT